jgi:hypothetical protein
MVVLLSAAIAVGASAYLYRRFEVPPALLRLAAGEILAARPGQVADSRQAIADVPPAVVDRRLPADAALTILVASYSLAGETAAAEVASLTRWLESSGFRVFYADVDLGPRGRWQRVLAGAYTDPEAARRDEERLKAAAPQSDVHLVSAGFATGLVANASTEPDADARHSGTEP